MFQELKNYFKYNPETMNLGFGGFTAAAWINIVTIAATPWNFIVPLIYLAYTGKKLFIIFATVGLAAFTLWCFKYGISLKSYKSDVYYGIFVFIPFLRDMYFLYKYQINAFIYKDKTLEEIQGSEWKFKIYFVLLCLICIALYWLSLRHKS